MANTAYEPNEKDRAVVTAMASYGIPQEDIGKQIGVSHVTLRKYYESELEMSAPRADAKVAEMLFQSCIATIRENGKDIPDPRFNSCRFFWLKCRAGWREVERHDYRFVDEHGKDRPILGLDAVQAYMNSVPDAPSE